MEELKRAAQEEASVQTLYKQLYSWQRTLGPAQRRLQYANVGPEFSQLAAMSVRRSRWMLVGVLATGTAACFSGVTAGVSAFGIGFAWFGGGEDAARGCARFATTSASVALISSVACAGFAFKRFGHMRPILRQLRKESIRRGKPWTHKFY